MKSSLNRILGALLLAVSLAGGWVWSEYRQFLDTPLTIPKEGRIYLLPKGTSAAVVARDFADPAKWRNIYYFRLFNRLDPRARKLQAGEYAIPNGTTPSQLLDILGSGKVIHYPVTLVEGWSFKQFLEVLAKVDILEHTLSDADSAEIMAKLGRTGIYPEGRFLPDTYLFPRGASDLDVLRRAMASMDKVLAVEWEKRQSDLPLKNAEEALILASIVEKETGLASERAEIAGVFVRRLKRGMKLQTDPTVIYGMGDSFDGNIRRSDLRRDTPYNTYVHAGLPPTPIALPGRDAIHAVLHPADGKALYFVAKGDGSHQFSATLAAHNRAVRKYQLKK